MWSALALAVLLCEVSFASSWVIGEHDALPRGGFLHNWIIAVASTPFAHTGVMNTWSYQSFRNETGTITPLLVSGSSSSLTIWGVGTTRNHSSMGIHSFCFDLVDGSATVDTSTYFAFYSTGGWYFVAARGYNTSMWRFSKALPSLPSAGLTYVPTVYYNYAPSLQATYHAASCNVTIETVVDWQTCVWYLEAIVTPFCGNSSMNVTFEWFRSTTPNGPFTLVGTGNPYYPHMLDVGNYISVSVQGSLTCNSSAIFISSGGDCVPGGSPSPSPSPACAPDMPFCFPFKKPLHPRGRERYGA